MINKCNILTIAVIDFLKIVLACLLIRDSSLARTIAVAQTSTLRLVCAVGAVGRGPSQSRNATVSLLFLRRLTSSQLSQISSFARIIRTAGWRGFRADEDHYRSEHLIYSIDRYLACGANHLLNAEPTTDSALKKILRRIGR
ncbi:MAG: hypothetical protein ABI210_13965 [Abditibacteriaceae bacterium]